MELNKESKIDISVIIPAHNEEELLPLCLQSLKEQKFFANYEVIVVDNASTDETVEIAKKFKAKLLYEKKRGVGFARQKGFSRARGKIIASTDADTVLPKDWLEKIYLTFRENPEVIGVTGRVDFFGQHKKRLFLVNIFAPVFKFLSRIISFKRYFVAGANFAIKKDIFQKIGGFNTSLAIEEDTDLAIRARKFGKFIFRKDLYVITSARRWQKNLSSWKGVKKIFNIHFLNFIWQIFFKKPKVNKFYNVRVNGNNYYFFRKKS